MGYRAKLALDEVANGSAQRLRIRQRSGESRKPKAKAVRGRATLGFAWGSRVAPPPARSARLTRGSNYDTPPSVQCSVFTETNSLLTLILK